MYTNALIKSKYTNDPVNMFVTNCGPLIHVFNSVAPVDDINPQFCNNPLPNCILANNADIRITGMLLVYKKFNGHLTPNPLTLPKLSGISTFIACAYTDITNTTTVAIIADIAITASFGAPASSDVKKTMNAPIGGCPEPNAQDRKST